MGKFYKFGRIDDCEFITDCTDCGAELWVDEYNFDLVDDVGAKLLDDGQCQWTCDSCQREMRKARKAHKLAAAAESAAVEAAAARGGGRIGGAA